MQQYLEKYVSSWKGCGEKVESYIIIMLNIVAVISDVEGERDVIIDCSSRWKVVCISRKMWK